MRNINLFKLLILLPVTIIFHIDYANGQNELPQIIPAPPQATSLREYIDIPVGYYTGIPETTIPIYTLIAGKLKLPISLNYHAAGVRVGDRAGAVGLKWDLNAGGKISRNILGKDDLTGWLTYNYDYKTAFRDPALARLDQAIQSHYNFIYGMYAGQNDGQPDEFFYTLPGMSGRFVFDNQNIIRMIPQNDIKIIPSSDYSLWTVYDTEGNKYVTGGENFNETTVTDADVTGLDHITSWVLKQMISRDSADEIDFTYTDEIINDPFVAVQESISVATNETPASVTKITAGTYFTKLLTRITSKQCIINFFYSDQNGSDPGKKLDRVQILNVNGTLIKDIRLNYSFFNGNARLRLDSVNEVSATGIVNPAYAFQYNNIALPQRNSKSSDKFGYYNGKPNASLIPTREINGYQYTGGNRGVDTAFIQAGILKKIVFPTKGVTTFEYENNQIGGASTQDVMLNTNVGFGKNQAPVNVYTKNFTINQSAISPITTVSVYSDCDIKYFLNPTDPPDFNSVSILNASGTVVKTWTQNNSKTTSVKGYFNLAPGNYTIQIQFNNSDGSASLDLSFTQPSGQTIVSATPGAGLRVKRITTDDNNGTQEIKTFKYAGGVGAIPLIFDRSYIAYQRLQGQPGHNGIGTDCSYLQINYLQVSSNSKLNLSANQASGVMYHNVEVWHGDNAENGKEKMVFNTTPDVYNGTQTFCPPTSYEHRNGLLLSKELVSQSGNTVYKEVNRYDFSLNSGDASQYQTIDGATESAQSSPPCMVDQLIATADNTNTYDNSSVCFNLNPGEQVFNHAQKFSYDVYHIFSEKVRKIATTQYHYGSNGLFQDSVVINYSYSAALHNQVIAEQHTDSKGAVIQTRYTYPFEMVSSGRDGNGVYQAMINQNLISPVIELIELKNGVQTHLTRTNYGQPYTGILVPQYIETQTFSSLPAESRLRYNTYDTQGNVLSVSKESGPKTVYIWGYGGQYPVAEIRNAEYSVVESVLGGSGSVTTFKNNLIPTAADVNAFLAPLRTAATLSNAQVTTYTYAPLVGMTSSTDAKGMTTYYEYDAFQRLMNVKDKDGNIVRHTDYHYQGQ